MFRQWLYVARTAALAKSPVGAVASTGFFRFWQLTGTRAETASVRWPLHAMGYIRLLPPFSQVGEYEPPISVMADYTTLLRAAMEQGFPLEPAIAALRERVHPSLRPLRPCAR